MGETQELFDKETLKQVLLSGTLMVAIDQDFNKNEWAACHGFLEDHWKEDYGSTKVFFKEVIDELKYILLSGSQIPIHIDKLAHNLSDRLTAEQKKTVIGFIKKVMEADGHLTPNESDLYRKFTKSFHSAG